MVISLLLAMLSTGCVRPSDDYETRVLSQGTTLDQIEPAPTPMGGAIEYARFRLWGTNLGLGVTGLFGDLPRADGQSFVLGSANLGYPRDAAFDRGSAFVSPGPRVAPESDGCQIRLRPSMLQGFSEYVDVGDQISLTDADGGVIHLERDPSAHPRPAGESFYVGYGGVLGAVVQGHPLLPDSWRSGAAYSVYFPGSFQAPEATLGVIPYPTSGAMRLPADIEGLRINGDRVRAPIHRWDPRFEASVCSPEADSARDDDVRFAGPWEGEMRLRWQPSASGDPLTVIVRYLGEDIEGSCPLGSDSECGPGFHCDTEGACLPDEGSTSVVLAELACTFSDDGAASITPDQLEQIDAWLAPSKVRGAILVVARISEGTIALPDVRTSQGRRVPITPLRTRGIDAIFTRLGWPTVAESARGRR